MGVVGGVARGGVRVYVKPKEAMGRVAGASTNNEAPPVHPSLVFRDIVKRLGTLVPVSPKDVTVMQRRLIRAGYRKDNALKVLYGAKLLLGGLMPALAFFLVSKSEIDPSNKTMYVVPALSI